MLALADRRGQNQDPASLDKGQVTRPTPVFAIHRQCRADSAHLPRRRYRRTPGYRAGALGQHVEDIAHLAVRAIQPGVGHGRDVRIRMHESQAFHDLERGVRPRRERRTGTGSGQNSPCRQNPDRLSSSAHSFPCRGLMMVTPGNELGSAQERARKRLVNCCRQQHVDDPRRLRLHRTDRRPRRASRARRASGRRRERARPRESCRLATRTKHTVSRCETPGKCFAASRVMPGAPAGT